MNFLNKIKQGLIRFMQGRYGLDHFSIFLFIISIPFIYINVYYLYYIGYALELFCLFRMFSKNHGARRKELAKYNNIIGNKIVKTYRSIKNRKKRSKNHLYFKCPKCKKTIRVPKNKGKIKVTCPSCKTVIVKKT